MTDFNYFTLWKPTVADKRVHSSLPHGDDLLQRDKRVHSSLPHGDDLLQRDKRVLSSLPHGDDLLQRDKRVHSSLPQGDDLLQRDKRVHSSLPHGDDWRNDLLNEEWFYCNPKDDRDVLQQERNTNLANILTNG